MSGDKVYNGYSGKKLVIEGLGKGLDEKETDRIKAQFQKSKTFRSVRFVEVDAEENTVAVEVSDVTGKTDTSTQGKADDQAKAEFPKWNDWRKDNPELKRKDYEAAKALHDQV